MRDLAPEERHVGMPVVHERTVPALAGEQFDVLAESDGPNGGAG